MLSLRFFEDLSSEEVSVIIIHAWGIRYEYHMRSMLYVDANDVSVLSYEAYDWVSLVTCRGYNFLEDSYEQRVVARAVLVSSGLDGEIYMDSAADFGIGGR